MNLPIGGTTGLSHEHSEAITEAATWLAVQSPRPSPIVPELQRRFGLSAVDACQTIREANLIRGRAI